MLGLHAFGAVAVAACVIAGLWQLGVYNGRIDDARATRQSRGPVELERVWTPDQPFTNRLDGQAIRVDGRFAAKEQQVWVTDRDGEGRRGAWLVAPLRVTGTSASLLVVRGWAAAPGKPVDVPSGTVTIDAVLEPSEGSGTPFDPTDRTIGTLSVPTLINVVPGHLYSGFAIATTDAVRGGLSPVEPPEPDVSWTTGLRNLAYALQWWVFGAFALFMWWRMATENVAMRRAEAAAEADFDPPVA
jgi:cytochrome oxidase assembly protein ShyY1